ncbi:MAG: amino acid adenylation domain-containing protein [Lachnospiraceae bacterium]|nr:amino acid adenylation domain-containing protein [Lachnospiraceae bacterium]
MIISVLDYLEEAAGRFPDKTAFADTEESFSFRRLAECAKATGSRLAAAIPEKKPVAVCMKKGANNIAAFLGAVSAGCFYVPIDVQMPPERISLILEVLKPEAVICDEPGAESIRNAGGDYRILLYADAVATPPDEELLRKRRENIKSTDLLYVLFTSGSTGTPKGVTIPHAAMIDMTEWMCEKYALSETNSFCNQAPFYFDASVPDIYLPLKLGASCYIPPKSYYTFPKKILQFISEKAIDTLIWVPSALCNVVRARAFETCVPESVKLVIFCGEVMPCRFLNEWRRRIPEALYVNMYGPTEACYACTYYDVVKDFADDGVLPLGKACENSTALILDGDRLCAPGETGELCILGECLSYGYYNSPERTGEAFVQNPLNPQYREMMYRTGDLAYVAENGEMMFVGRKDSQIKRLGHRIELGEIEHAILADEGISNACCVYDSEKSDIIAIYSGSLSEEELKGKLGEKLPAYMLPTRFVRMMGLPMNINGKIDRALLKKEYGGGQNG